jgi:hypothetical protein
MLFTRLGSLVAALALLFGCFNFIFGLMIAAEVFGPPDVLLARSFPWAKTTGDVINKGFYALLFATALGTLTEISYAVRGR